MTYQAILFDLDGTLLPMDLDQFTEGYFHLLAQTAAPYGYREETLVPALWKGVGAMVKIRATAPIARPFGRPSPRCWGLRCMTTFQFLTPFMRRSFRRPGPLPAPIRELPRQWHWPGGRQSG